MVTLNIYGELLGAGKTTLIKQMLKTTYAGYRTAVIENEIGTVDLDAEILKSAAVSVREIYSGCICCTVKGSFKEAVRMIVEQEDPEYIVVEPSGVADIADVVKACSRSDQVHLGRVIMVVNAKKQQTLLKVVGQFYLRQLCNAQTLYLNFTEGMSQEELNDTKEQLWEINPDLTMVTVPIKDITAGTFPERQVKIATYGKKDPGDWKISKSTEDGIVRIRSRRDQRLFVQCCRFKRDFTEDEIHGLMKIFQQEECTDIWRIKGCLKMRDGRFRKIDMVFGDRFLEEVQDFDDGKVNQLVFIGKKLNTPWLRKQMKPFGVDAWAR